MMQFEFEDHSYRLGTQKIETPKFELIAKALSNWNMDDQSFFTLTAQDGSYVQTAGSKERAIIEYRKIHNQGFNHYVLGYGNTEKTKTTVRYSGGEISLYMDEVLDLDHALNVFSFFFETQTIPSVYTLRELDEDYF